MSINKLIRLIESTTGKKVVLKELNSNRDKNILVKNASTLSDSFSIFRADLQTMIDSLESVDGYDNEKTKLKSLNFKIQNTENVLNSLIR